MLGTLGQKRIRPQDQEMQEAQEPEADREPKAALNLNEPPAIEEALALDLNQPLDLDPVIINLVQPAVNGDFIELNYLQGNEEVHYLLQHENEVYQLNPLEHDLMELADKAHQEEEGQGDLVVLALPASLVYWQVEVPLDQLVSSEEEQELNSEGQGEQGNNDNEQVEQPVQEQADQIVDAQNDQDVQTIEAQNNQIARIQINQVLSQELAIQDAGAHNNQITQSQNNQIAGIQINQVLSQELAVQDAGARNNQIIQSHNAQVTDTQAVAQVARSGIQVAQEVESQAVQAIQNQGPLIQREQTVGEQEFLDEYDFFQALIAEGEQQTQSQFMNQNFNAQFRAALTTYEEGNPARSQALDAEATRLWAKFFSSGNLSNFNVSIPTTQANFFTVLLLSKDNFLWAREILSSRIISLLNCKSSGVIDFSIPIACPQKTPLRLLENVCVEMNQDIEVSSKEASSPGSKKRARKRSTIIVETEVKRSPRLKDSTKGFKLAGCTNKKCLAYGTTPPF